MQLIGLRYPKGWLVDAWNLSLAYLNFWDKAAKRIEVHASSRHGLGTSTSLNFRVSVPDQLRPLAKRLNTRVGQLAASLAIELSRPFTPSSKWLLLIMFISNKKTRQRGRNVFQI